MSLDKIFGLYTRGLPRRHRAHRDRREARPVQQPDDRLDLHGAVAADLRRSSASSPGPRIPTSTTWPAAASPLSTTAWPPARTGCRPPRSSRWAAPCPRRASPGLAYVMGWTGGYLLLAVFLGPYLRQFGAYTIPDFLGARFGGNQARIVGVVGAVVCSFTYLIAQVTGVGLIVARFIGIDFNVGVFVGLHRRAVLLGARRDEVGHVDPGRAVHHPDRLLPGPRRVPVVDSSSRSRSPS